MAVIWSPGINEDFPHDETLQYLLILCSKVALNTLVLSFWRHSILRSLLGLCSVSMYVADMLLVSAVTGAWLFKEHLPTSTSMCFILAHGSAVYALLPLPILIAGALDYASYPYLDVNSSSQRRAVSYCIVVVLMWTLACSYTYNYTDTQPMEIYKDNARALVCRVHGSSVVFQFSMQLSIAVVLILLLTLGFALNWMPYLLMCLACALVGFVVPAYASVNLLWMACANSVLVGIAFWCRSDGSGPLGKFPDDTCLWNIYWHLSKGTSPTVDAKLTTRLYIIVHKPAMTFREI
uniref:Probable G-protein coupled receptor 160 n=1 Tax=Sinocyclocheilus anshuiensis TaxID=1608454 RepID=A0A671R0Z3_9TELE